MPEVTLSPTKISVGIDELKLKTPDFDAALAGLLGKVPVAEPDKVIFNVDRKVPIEDATKMAYVLFDAGAKKLEARTTARADFPDKLILTPDKQVADNVPPCTFTGMVVDDLGVGFWPIKGGVTAKRYTKGMAGPDFSAFHEVFHKDEASCPATVFYISAEEGVDWGHAFDLGGSILAYRPEYKIKTLVLLRTIPVPGTKVKVAP